MTVPPPGTGRQAGEPEGSHRDDDSGFSPETTISLHAVSADTSPDVGLSSAEQKAIEALPAGSALLIVQRGPNAGARFLLDAERTTAGRHPGSDIFLDDVTVSRKHAEFVVRDVGSLNGTYVRRDRIDEMFLRDGDEVQIGKFRMIFHPSRRGSGASTGW